MKRFRIATIPGDGIGKEVVPVGRSVLDAAAVESARRGATDAGVLVACQSIVGVNALGGQRERDQGG